MHRTQTFRRAGLQRLIASGALVIAGLAAVVLIEPGDNQPSAARDETNRSIVAAVATHLTLPTGEQPVISVIDNAALLARQQAFFAQANNGDYLLLYANANKAVIYRAQEDRIINVGPTVRIPSGPAD